MSSLLTKRLIRSLDEEEADAIRGGQHGCRRFVCRNLVWEHTNSVHNSYENIYSDDEEGTNLADVWVENTAFPILDGEIADSLCSEIAQNWPDPELPLVLCEPRGSGWPDVYSEEGDEKLVPAVWHGIDEGRIDKVWMPEHECCSCRLAVADDEIVLDEHAASGMGIEVGDIVSIGAYHSSMDFTVVGIGYHPYHLYYAFEGSILPADPGTFARLLVRFGN